MNFSTAELRKHMVSTYKPGRLFQLLPVVGRFVGAANRLLIITSNSSSDFNIWTDWYKDLLGNESAYSLDLKHRSKILSSDDFLSFWDQDFRYTWRGRLVEIDEDVLSPKQSNSVRVLNETLITYWVMSVEYKLKYKKFFPLVSCHPTLYGPHDMTSGYSSATDTCRHLRSWFSEDLEKTGQISSMDGGWFRNIDTYTDILVGYFNGQLEICQLGKHILGSRKDLDSIPEIRTQEQWSRETIADFFFEFESKLTTKE